jgi:hypothetical protein
MWKRSEESCSEMLCPNVPQLETERFEENVEGLLIQ